MGSNSLHNQSNGLTSEEAMQRLREYGPNEVSDKRDSSILLLARKFWGLTPWMLEFTVILEWLLGKTTEAYVIIALLVFNAVVGFLQEDKANKAVELLRRRLAIRTRVKRDGKWIQIEAKELVPGDVIRLRAGDISPGDSVLADGNLEVDQSALTGESLTVERIIDDPLYSGSIVKIGEATTVVT